MRALKRTGCATFDVINGDSLKQADNFISGRYSAKSKYLGGRRFYAHRRAFQSHHEGRTKHGARAVNFRLSDRIN